MFSLSKMVALLLAASLQFGPRTDKIEVPLRVLRVLPGEVKPVDLATTDITTFGNAKQFNASIGVETLCEAKPISSAASTSTVPGEARPRTSAADSTMPGEAKPLKTIIEVETTGKAKPLKSSVNIEALGEAKRLDSTAKSTTPDEVKPVHLVEINRAALGEAKPQATHVHLARRRQRKN
jgi:hypothetical protein